MIHPRRGASNAPYVVAFAFIGVCLAVAAVAIASGNVAVGFAVPGKSVVTLAVLALIALTVRLRGAR